MDKLQEVDFILMQFEDWMHGEDGKKVTYARKLIKELSASSGNEVAVCPKQNVHKWFGVQGYKYCDECGANVEGQTDH